MPGAGHKDREIGQRIHSAYINSGYFDKTFVEILPLLGDITQSAFSMYMSGERVPPMNRMVAIAKLFDVCVEWLYTGRGPRKPITRPYDELADRMMKCSEKNLKVTRWVLGLLEKEEYTAEQIRSAVLSIHDDAGDEFFDDD